MKKTNKLLSVLLILSIFCSCLVCINANAIQTFEVHDSCVKEHFEWVQFGRFPTNVVGSCPFVTIALLLSFYDAYWHDDFLLPDYETAGTFNVNTGKIESDFHFTREDVDWNAIVTQEGLDPSSEDEEDKEAVWDAYSQFVVDNSGDYLQLYLIDLAIKEGYFDDINSAYDNEYLYGLNANEMVDFLEYYLYEERDFTPAQVTVNKQSAILPSGRDGMFNTAKELIESGVPVIYGASNINVQGVEWISDSIFNNSGHAMFGYDVIRNENNQVDDIVLSLCLNGYDTTSLYTTEYEYYSDIIWLEINEDALPHVCSDSYVETGISNGEGLCTCEIYSEHPNHTHVDRELPIRTDSLKHLYYCYCGHVVPYPHTYTYTMVDGTYHYANCVCGYSQLLLHTYTYTQKDSMYHTVKCGCGYSYTEMHPGANSVNKPRKCSKCNYVFVTFEPWANPNITDKFDQ